MREVNYIFPSSSEVKNDWSYTSAPLMRLHGVAKDQIYLSALPKIKKRKTDYRCSLAVLVYFGATDCTGGRRT